MLKRLAPLAAITAAISLAACGGSNHQPTGAQPQHGGRIHSQAFLRSAEHPTGLQPPSPFSAISQISGYDAVTASAIPYGAQVALCYANGTYANCGAVSARHPKHLVTIAVNTSVPARLLDVEPGDATPSQAGSWVHQTIYAFHVYRPGIYANASTMPAVRASLNAWHLSRSQYVLMVAAWDGNAVIPAGYDAKQYRSTQALDYDSFATSFFAPAPKPKPTAPRCYHHGWAQPRTKANEALCNQVRKHDAYLGLIVKHQDGYLAVTNGNIARLNRQIAQLQAQRGNDLSRHTAELHARDNAAGNLAADLKKYGFTG